MYIKLTQGVCMTCLNGNHRTGRKTVRGGIIWGTHLVSVQTVIVVSIIPVTEGQYSTASRDAFILLSCGSLDGCAEICCQIIQERGAVFSGNPLQYSLSRLDVPVWSKLALGKARESNQQSYSSKARQSTSTTKTTACLGCVLLVDMNTSGTEEYLGYKSGDDERQQVNTKHSQSTLLQMQEKISRECENIPT